MSFGIKNPLAKDGVHKQYLNYVKRVSKYRVFEIGVYKSSPYNLFLVKLNLSWRGSDHAGPEFSLELFGYYFQVSLYKTLHWDYDNGTWES